LGSCLTGHDSHLEFLLRLEDFRQHPVRQVSTAPDRNHMQPAMTQIAPLLACIFLLVAATQTVHASTASGQLCWTVGKYDNTVFIAGIDGREDRAASFASLIEISGVEAPPAKCASLPVAGYRALRALLVEEWMDAELEVIDTTYLSDLDY
jgi:hypothetical protein